MFTLRPNVLWTSFAIHLARPHRAPPSHQPGRRGRTRRPANASAVLPGTGGRPYKPFKSNFIPMNFCWPTWMTFMLWSPPPEFAKSMTSWPTNFTGTRTSNSIVAKPACGMLPAPSPPTWHLWDQMCGSAAQPYPATSKDSQSSALP